MWLNHTLDLDRERRDDIPSEAARIPKRLGAAKESGQGPAKS
jgi:transcriptional regulator of met regulon